MNEAEISFVITVGVIIAFYLIFIRPAQKEQRRHKQQIRDLRPGDEVLTTSGFIARVRDIQVPERGPTRIKLELADGVVVTALTSAIQQRVTGKEAGEARPSEPVEEKRPLR
jgi:preprotein translocase subunit YajC